MYDCFISQTKHFLLAMGDLTALCGSTLRYQHPTLPIIHPGSAEIAVTVVS